LTGVRRICGPDVTVSTPEAESPVVPVTVRVNGPAVAVAASVKLAVS